MAEKRNKFAFDRDYYRDMSERMVSRYGQGLTNGSAARKLDLYDDDLDLFDESVEEAYRELYAEPLEKEPAPARRQTSRAKSRPDRRPARRPEVVSEPEVKLKRVWNIDMMHVLMLMIAVAALVFTCYRYLGTKAELSETGKQVTAMESKLQTLRSKNSSELAELNKPMDSEYLLSYAVTRLGMVYPNENTTFSYQVSDSGYVKQYEQMPEESGKGILDVLIP
ncbi:MAG: septum formation initiator family protein [Lachnospiraceae bacterium]|nr:septum formation initiator family protein [Lachnospiraceae bacterium]